MIYPYFWRSGMGRMLLLSCLLVVAIPAAAQPEADPHRWQFYGELFLWGASLDGKSVTGDIDVPFDDIFDSLEFAAMGTVAASRDKWVLFADLIYLDVEDGASVTAGALAPGVQAEVDVGVKGFTSTLGGAYRVVHSERASFHALAGARYFSLDADVDVGIPAVSVQQRLSDSGSVWDGVIGVRGEIALGDNEKWYLTYYGDIGTGDSDLTWHAVGGINYRFERAALVVGYSHLEWDFDSGSLVKDLSISGPYAGLQYRF
jgi:hypothetical protein